MMGISIKVTGQKEATAAIDKIQKKIAAAMEPALSAGGVVVQTEWGIEVKARAWHTGDYFRSIHQLSSKSSGDKAEVIIGTSITAPPYPFFQEYGYKLRNGKRQPGKHVAISAWDRSKGRAAKEVEAVLRHVVGR